ANDSNGSQSNQDNYNMGYIAYHLKDYKKAVKELEKVSEPDAYFQASMIILGDAFLKEGNKEGARNAFFRASKLDFDAESKELGLLNFPKLSFWLEFHQVALEATHEFLSTYKSSSRVDEAKTLLAEVLFSTKNDGEAVDILETIPKRNQEANTAY